MGVSRQKDQQRFMCSSFTPKNHVNHVRNSCFATENISVNTEQCLAQLMKLLPDSNGLTKNHNCAEWGWRMHTPSFERTFACVAYMCV